MPVTTALSMRPSSPVNPALSGGDDDGLGHKGMRPQGVGDPGRALGYIDPRRTEGGKFADKAVRDIVVIALQWAYPEIDSRATSAEILTVAKKMQVDT